jgi:DNA polymerase I-like protein with 3'-5' exonuclease and polymerase domains
MVPDAIDLYRISGDNIPLQLARTYTILLPTLPYHVVQTMADVYDSFWMPFGELLTDLEKEGFLVDREHLRAAESRAVADAKDAENRFRLWAQRYADGAECMNIRSGPQVVQLLFGSVTAPHPAMPEPMRPIPTRTFRAENIWGYKKENQKRATKMWEFNLGTVWGRDPRTGNVMLPSVAEPEDFTPKRSVQAGTPVLRKYAGKPGSALKALLSEFPDSSLCAGMGEDFVPLEGDDDTGANLVADGGSIDFEEIMGPEEKQMSDDEGEGVRKKSKDGTPNSATARVKIKGKDTEAEAEAEAENASESTTCVDGGEEVADDLSTADADQIKEKLGGAWWAMGAEERAALHKEAKVKGYGKMYEACGGGQAGLEACAALDFLCEVSAIETLTTNFIQPLQGFDIATEADGRVHCSLNLNTETGRLSARRPNLQNQPALEKDRYRVRQAFTANKELGHTLIVADYGQLELRLLAHMANCASMIEAFHLGGDFHSRTALSMYDHIQQAVANKEVLLEWEGNSPEEESPIPLIKDVYGSERRRAKILNFSLAYGKTAHGLSKDFGVGHAEAEETIKKWYSARPEVEEWQERMRYMAIHEGYVPTLLGRRRTLPGAAKGNFREKGHAMRAAINTPIQGSAADVASACMLKIRRHPRLRELGWKLLLQVHDEVILEGPEESSAEARAIVVRCMENPFSEEDVDKDWLRVKLAVDSNIAPTWYEAK